MASATKSGRTIFSSREFNQAASRAKKAADKGPVFITDRGRTSHVLLSIEEYEKIAGKPKTILELLYMPGVGDIDFEPPRLGDEFIRPADFS
jgi:prevent-host-death family protein